MEIFRKLVSKITAKRLQQIDYFRLNPIEVQAQVFTDLVNAGNETVFGAEHKLSVVKSYSDYEKFCKRIPVRTYEQLQPYINRIINGEQNILWNSEIKWFAKSSGTTNAASKFIPISKESLEECHFRGGRDIIALYTAVKPDNNMLLGRSLAVGGSQQINSFNNDVYYGDLSAVIIQNLPFWANILRTPDKATALLPEWEEKIEKMAEKSSKVNVTNIAGVPSWTLLLLKRVLEISGTNNLREVWPNLEIFVHGGVSFAPYRSEYDALMSSPGLLYMETYNASEGFLGIQDDLNDPSMLLMLDYGIFYEFIPMADFDKPTRPTIPLEAVELGKNYAVVMTTNGGLWRYLIGDTVKFTSLTPYKFIITGRTKHFINAFGEELIIDNAERALMFACEQTGAVVSEYSGAPIFMSESSSGGHEWIVEFSTPPADLQMFTSLFDQKLKVVNTDYASKRHKNMTMQMPKIHIARTNLFFDWMKKRGKAGGQNKVPRLSNSREFLDELLVLNT